MPPPAADTRVFGILASSLRGMVLSKFRRKNCILDSEICHCSNFNFEQWNFFRLKFLIYGAIFLCALISTKQKGKNKLKKHLNF